MLIKGKGFSRAMGMVSGSLGWIGLVVFGTILVMGERGPTLVAYGLAPTFLSLGLLAVGGRLWQGARGQDQLGIYLATTFFSATILALVLNGAVMIVNILRR